MKSAEFHRMLDELGCLTRSQRHRLRDELDRKILASEVVTLLDRDEDGKPACPHCHGERIYKWGVSSGLQRYRCRQCLRTFNTLTHTPLARLRHKEKWLSYGEALIEGLSVRKAAARCGVAKNTSFKWRHRFLQSPSAQKAEQMQGIAEADETFFRESFKGKRNMTRKARKRGGKHKGAPSEMIPVLVVRDRHGATADFLMQGVSAKDIEPVLTPLLSSDIILCTDGASAYHIVARHICVEHHQVNTTRGIRVVRRAYHIQNVNAYDRRLKQWMDRFHGVATRYLENYLGWRRMIERFGNSINPKTCLYAALGDTFQQLNTT